MKRKYCIIYSFLFLNIETQKYENARVYKEIQKGNMRDKMEEN